MKCTLIDITGQTFGMLVVESRHPDATRGKQARWVCLCECGNRSVVVGSKLRNGHTRSCGCLKAKLAGDRLRTHGRSKSPEHETWARMQSRCNSPSASAYHRYGGRGISVCERWKSFPNFLADMGPKPSPRHSIERIDSNGNYEPSNCRWATPYEQAQNTARNVYVRVDGEVAAVSAMARKHGIPTGAVYQRLRAGWSIERTFSEPLRVRAKPVRNNQDRRI